MSSTGFNSSPAAACVPAEQNQRHATFRVCDYDLAETLCSGQAFRWELRDGGWEGTIRDRWVRLALEESLAPPGGTSWHDSLPDPSPSFESTVPPVRNGSAFLRLTVETAEPVREWAWLRHYLQTEVDLGAVLDAFPADEAMREAVRACRGLRLLRQPAWECLASFLLSSTKQIVQIRQIVALLCARFGNPLPVPSGHDPVHSFPTAARLAEADESELRGCKMGFRAPYLRETARMVATGELNLEALGGLPVEEARAELIKAPGVGRKIADCVLLFAYGCQSAFPVDVWVSKALRQLYFPKRRVSPKRLRHFSETYFGEYAGYAQQYLFHYMRTRQGTTVQHS